MVVVFPAPFGPRKPYHATWHRQIETSQREARAVALAQVASREANSAEAVTCRRRVAVAARGP